MEDKKTNQIRRFVASRNTWEWRFGDNTPKPKRSVQEVSLQPRVSGGLATRDSSEHGEFPRGR